MEQKNAHIEIVDTLQILAVIWVNNQFIIH